MKGNWSTVLVGRQVVLVPYRKEHVAKYHEWMQDEELLRQTASECLSLEEEYANCDEWRNDEKKLTWIILDKAACFKEILFPIEAMIGDCNAFLSSDDDMLEAELAVMVAEASSRRHGFGLEAVRLLMTYLHESMNKKYNFIAKIDQNNQASFQLFTKKLGFRQSELIEAFAEVHLVLPAASFQEPAEYAVLSYDEKINKNNHFTFSKYSSDISVLSIGPHTSFLFLGDSVQDLVLSGPTIYQAGEPAASSLIGDSGGAQTVARRLSKTTKRFIALTAGPELSDDSPHLTSLTLKAMHHTPPSGTCALDYPSPSPFDSDLVFTDHDDLFSFVKQNRKDAQAAISRPTPQQSSLPPLESFSAADRGNHSPPLQDQHRLLPTSTVIYREEDHSTL